MKSLIMIYYHLEINLMQGMKEKQETFTSIFYHPFRGVLHPLCFSLPPSLSPSHSTHRSLIYLSPVIYEEQVPLFLIFH